MLATIPENAVPIPVADGSFSPALKRALRRGTIAVGLFCGATACAAPYPTADQLRHATMEVAAQLKSEQMEVTILDAQKEDIKLPLMAAGLRLEDGVCVVYYNASPEDGHIQFFEPVTAQDLPIWLNSIAALEVTHCIEQREAYIRRRFDVVLPPGARHENVTVQGYFPSCKAVRWRTGVKRLPILCRSCISGTPFRSGGNNLRPNSRQCAAIRLGGGLNTICRPGCKS